MDREQNILDNIFKICEEEGVDKTTFLFTEEPLSKEKKEIQKEYTNITVVFFTGIPIYDENAKLCFEGAFRKLLWEIKNKYDAEIWQIRKPEEEKEYEQKKKVS